MTREQKWRRIRREALLAMGAEAREWTREANLGRIGDDAGCCRKCGLRLAGIPIRRAAHGAFIAPWWLCPACNLPDIIDELARLQTHAERIADAKVPAR